MKLNKERHTKRKVTAPFTLHNSLFKHATVTRLLVNSIKKTLVLYFSRFYLLMSFSFCTLISVYFCAITENTKQTKKKQTEGRLCSRNLNVIVKCQRRCLGWNSVRRENDELLGFLNSQNMTCWRKRNALQVRAKE